MSYMHPGSINSSDFVTPRDSPNGDRTAATARERDMAAAVESSDAALGTGAYTAVSNNGSVECLLSRYRRSPVRGPENVDA